MRYITFSLIFLSCLMCFNSTVYGLESGTPQKVILSTFDVSSGGRYAYLRDGISSMLASRLSAMDGVELLDQKISDEKLAGLKKGEGGDKGVSLEPGVDYLVAGSLFALKKGLNIQVVVYPLSPGGKIEHFSAVAEDDGSVISTLDTLSQDIGASVFGLQTGGADAETGGKRGAGTKGFVTVNPEAAYKRGLYSGSVVDIGDSAIQISTKGVRRTTDLSLEMIGMVVGDVDGDGTTEIILLTERELRVFQFTGRKAREIAKIKLPGLIKVHAINMADLDNDGRKEIYLSATKDLNVSSVIMEWDKTSGFSVRKQYIRWYIRPVFHPVRGMILAGQERGMGRTDFIKRGVFQLELNPKGDFVKAGEIALPKGVNLFDFTYADIDGDKVYETIVVDQNEKLKIYDQADGLLWVSSEKYGGSKRYIGPSQGEALDRNQNSSLSANEGSDREIIFVPGRIAVVDLDKNGRQDIVAVNNVEVSFSSYFNRIRLYDGGSVVGLTWNGSQMVETWRTGRQSGFLADFDFTLKKDTAAGSNGETGIATLYLGQIPNSGSLESLLPGMTRSKLSVYELGFSLKNPEVE
ncbi:MAG: VCBS repeat-containing protein [Deltaproteobacteria bacterium]|nr:VCBS repeat-containing protein [Deltaproteobacteria bacterium]